MVAGAIGTPRRAEPLRRAIGSPCRRAAPRNEPSRVPSPPMITMNRIRKLRSIENTSGSALPYQKNTIRAPATPQ